MNYDINNLESIKIKGYKNFWKVSTNFFLRGTAKISSTVDLTKLINRYFESPKEKFEDIKRVIRIHKDKMGRQYNDQKKKRTIGKTMIYKILHRKL